MRFISTFAVAVSLIVGGAAFGTPAVAQKKKQEAASGAQKKYNLSKAEIAVIAPLQKAVQAQDFATATSLLPAAQAAASGADAKYLVANFQLQIALAAKDEVGQAAAVEAMLASGGVPQGEQAKLYRALASLYQNLKQPERATAAFQKVAELEPNSTDAMLMMAESSAATNKAQAIATLERAMQAHKAAGNAIPENWYKRALKWAYEGKMASEITRLSRELVTAYRTADNWRDALTLYRQGSSLDKQAETDVLRLMRAAKAMKGDSDYLTLASNLNDMGLPGESKAVIDEGVQSRAINGSKDYFRQLLSATSGRVSADRASLPALKTKAMSGASGRLALTTGDAFYGYGDYASAAELYRAALQKGGVDANLVNTRLGAALALAGRRAEAEAAFKAVTGNRVTLAQFWMVWLSQRA